MGILDIEIVKGFMRMCNDGWLQGWHERNGGNLTYRMKEEEVAQCRPFFDPQPREWVNMGVQADNLAGEYFITTGSGKFFRNVEPDPVHSIGIVEINDKGDSWRIVWGLEDGAKPTSELMKTYQAAIWAQHGLFASGPDFDITFGLAHTIEKSAEIYVKVLSMGGGIIRQTITDDDLRAIARDFGVTLNEKFLN